MRMQKRKFRIGQLADKIGVERFVIRFWEKEFAIHTDRSDGGQRFYTEEDYTLFKKIKELLYERGFTIAGAKKQLQTTPTNATMENTKIIASSKTTLDPEQLRKQTHLLEQKIAHLHKQLIKLRELL